jgi:hypothetical protein
MQADILKSIEQHKDGLKSMLPQLKALLISGERAYDTAADISEEQDHLRDIKHPARLNYIPDMEEHIANFGMGLQILRRLIKDIEQA